MRSRPALSYEIRVSVGATTLLPLLGLPVFALLRWAVDRFDGSGAAGHELGRAFELILPLAGGLAAAHLMTVERQEGMAELRNSYPESHWRLPVLRTGTALVLLAVAGLLGGAAFRLVFGAVPLGRLLLPALGPGLFLLGLSMLVGNAIQSYWAAAAAVMGYWFLEVQTRGDVTGPLFLFQYTWPVLHVSYALNRWVLAGLGAAFLLANAWLSARRRRGKGIRLRADR